MIHTVRQSLQRISWRVQTLRATSSTRSLCSAVPAPQRSIKLCVLGGGNMAEAIISALSKSENQDMADIVVFDVNESRVEHLTATYGTKTCNNITEGMGEADVTLISVKPQNVESIGNLIQIPPKGLILSIVAGCTVDKLREVFKTDNIVRSMPNTPAMVMEAMTVWIATKQTPAEQVEQARYLLSAIGEQIEVKDENLIDMATAVSGSGPAYVFLTMEAMVDAAVHIGFPRDMAVKLVTTTIRGSASFAMQSEDTIGMLRNKVTSPGGTTASALYELEKGGFRTVVADAVWTAYRRSLELGGKSPNVGPGRNKTNEIITYRR